MDQDLIERYHAIPLNNGTWTCPDCNAMLVVNVPRLKKTQIKQHTATYAHSRKIKSKYEEARSRIADLEEMIEMILNPEDEE